MIVQIDAGHGGHDPGAVGSSLKEKDIALSVALKIGNILKGKNVKVIQSRSKDEFIDLTERSRIANSNDVDTFVSIHVNDFNKDTAQGFEVFSFTKDSKLAELVLNKVVRAKLYTKVRGLKTANFSVLRRTKAPAILIELGFIKNKDDVYLLKNKQDEFAEAIAAAIIEFLGVDYKVKKTKIELNGRVKEVDTINVDGHNYVKLQDLRDSKIVVDYDKSSNLPIIRVK